MLKSLILILLILGAVWLVADQISGQRYIGNFVNNLFGIKGA